MPLTNIYLDLIIPGLHERFATINAELDGQNIVFQEGSTLFHGEPATIQTFPTLYTILDEYEDRSKGQVDTFWYKSLHRICFQWQGGTEAAMMSERQLALLLDLVPASVKADQRLGNRLGRGIAHLKNGTAGWDEVASVVCRVLDFYSEVLYKKARN